MININLGNMLGAGRSIQSETSSSNIISPFHNFMSEFKLDNEKNGQKSTKIEGVDDELMLYNLICNLYQSLNTNQNIENKDDLQSIKNLLDSKTNLNELMNIKSIFNLKNNSEKLINGDSKLIFERNSNQVNNLKNISKANSSSNIELDNKFTLVGDDKSLDLNAIKEILNNISKNKKNINENKVDKGLDSLINKIKDTIQTLENSKSETITHGKLDTVGVLNMSKLDDCKSANDDSQDIHRLENIASSNDNSYVSLLASNNKLNTLYNNNVSNEITQPPTEIRQGFISEDILKCVKYMKSSDIEELSIKLNPRNLGEMIIKLSKTEKDSNLVITVQDKNVLDFVNNNIDDIKNHLKDVNVKINDVFVNVKQDDKNMFSDNLNQGFNKEQSFKQNKNSKYKNSNEIVDNLSINDTKDEDDNFNILI